MIITNPQRGSFQLSVIFKRDYFNLSKEDLLKKFEESKGEPEYSELSNLKDIQKDLLLSAC